MVIQHNISAMNANRQLGLTTGRLAKSSEKLSSGYKINRAADDAAGLSISEKMRKQIRGLDQAGENIEDGISLCQVADGALNETVSILQRMRELAVQSANGTNSASDREYIDMEITQLKNEVDRIAKTTSFNDAVYPLNAPMTKTTEILSVPAGDYDPNDGLIREKMLTFKTNIVCTYEGKHYNIGDTITILGLTTNDGEIWINNGDSYIGGKFSTSHSDYSNTKSLRKSDLKIDKDGYLYYTDTLGVDRYAIYMFGNFPKPSPNVVSGNVDPIHFIPKNEPNGSGFVNAGTARYMTVDDLGTKISETQPDIEMKTNYYFSSNEGVNVHAGDSSSQNNKIPIHIVNATCKGLGIAELTVVTEKSSDRALKLLDKAISTASSYRSAFGAVQNRLEHAQKIDANTSENTQAAESQIRDTDMAAEIVRYSNISILTQSGHSMLAQANQSKQGVLSLIA